MCHPSAPFVAEATGLQDQVESRPVDRVKCFPEVELEHYGRFSLFVAALDVLNRQQEAVGYVPTFDEASLVIWH